MEITEEIMSSINEKTCTDEDFDVYAGIGDILEISRETYIQRELHDYSKKTEELQNKLQVLAAENLNLETKNRDLQAQAEENEEKFKIIQEEWERMMSQKSDEILILHQRIQHLTEGKGAEIEDREQMSAILQRQTSELQIELNQKKKTIRESNRDIRDMRAELSTNLQRLASKEKEIESLIKSNDKLKEKKNLLDQKTKQLLVNERRHKNLILNIKEENDFLRKENKNIQTSMDKKIKEQKYINKKITENYQVQELNAERRLEETIETIKDENTKLRNQNQDLKNIREVCDRLTKENINHGVKILRLVI